MVENKTFFYSSFDRLDLDSGVRAITKGQLMLEFVALRKLNRLTDKGLEEIHSAFLKEIDFRENGKIGDQSEFFQQIKLI